MALIIGFVGGIAGIVGLSGKLVLPIIMKYTKRRKKKYSLKKDLKKAIDDLDYSLFLDVIYKTKQYDTTYEKYQFIKFKKFYKFKDRILTDKCYFFRRFDPNYTSNEEMLKSIVRKEIEYSLSNYEFNIEDLMCRNN